MVDRTPDEQEEKPRLWYTRDPKVPVSCPHCGADLNDDCNARLRRCKSSECGRYTYSEVLWYK